MPTPSPLARLRALAIARALPPLTTLPVAIERAAFIQADPIRAPARAQDLTLRQRVSGYRAGDLERLYPSLPVEEGMFYTYGFLHPSLSGLLHPRSGAAPLSKLLRRVLAFVEQTGETHPADLERHFGGARERNAWGGQSKATTLALDDLHGRGLLRIARREKGIRVYEKARASPEALSAEERSRRIVIAIARLLAPVPERSLFETINRVRRSLPTSRRDLVRALIESGELSAQSIDGVVYLSPREEEPRNEPHEGVRILSPFDPLVWDRRRFEHLWGWAYRFEAYTKAEKRVRGYYAMPLLFRDAVIGWANVTTQGGTLDVALGFVDKRPAARAFRTALDQEIEGLRAFLGETGPLTPKAPRPSRPLR